MKLATVTDEQRRRRVGTRHGLAPARRFAGVEEATRAMTVLHATDAATVYASLASRVDGVTVGDIDRALYDDRTLVKQLAMRRTLFVFPRELLPAAWGSAAARVSVQQRPRLVKDLVAAGFAGEDWLAAAERAIVAHLADGSEHTSSELRAALPEVEGRVRTNVGKKYEAVVSFAPRVLTQLSADGRVVRAHNGGHWRISRPRWASMEAWLGDDVVPLDSRSGYAAIVERWLRTFGPGTTSDIKWWLGSTVAAVKQALDDVGAVQVGLDGDEVGWAHADDVEHPHDDGDDEWAALVPTLDPTVMGWKRRGFYLDDAMVPDLFDTAGNAGNTSWWRGRVIGTWVQDDDGVVHVVPHPAAELPAIAHDALDVEARRLTEWLDGVIVNTVWASPAMQRARSALG